MSATVRCFLSYSAKDQPLLEELSKHLKPLKRTGLINDWHSQQINPGEHWSSHIHRQLNCADIILLLISSDFIYSDYCYNVEMQTAMNRHRSGESRVIPLFIRPVDWEGTPFSQLQGLPSNGQAVTTWDNQDAAWVDISKGIRKAVHYLKQEKTQHSSWVSPQSPSYTQVQAKTPEKLPGLAYLKDITGPDLVVVPAGQFRMGDITGRVGAVARPVHTVSIPHPLAMSCFPITVQQCWEFFQASHYTPGSRWLSLNTQPHQPAVAIHYQLANSYVDWLTQVTGFRYRLPTESEWEYAARAGQISDFSHGSSLTDQQAAYHSQQPREVGSFAANSFGLYDMQGNVWEWTQDQWFETYQQAPTDGQARHYPRSKLRVLRGGSWRSPLDHLRFAIRTPMNEQVVADNVGLRVVRELSSWWEGLL